MPPPTAERYSGVRAATLDLASSLSAEDCVVQSMPDASPTKWHLGHTTWFFETFVLESAEPGGPPFHAAYRVIFNSYYNTVGEQHPRPLRGLLTRPPLSEVLEYRRHVDERMTALLADGRLDDRALAVVELGLQHEQQHQELLLTDIKHALAQNPLRPAWRPDAAAPAGRPAPAMEWIRFDGGEREIGHAGDGFCFDNEQPRHPRLVPAFELASRPTTCGEYMDFIADRGYERPELWLSDGWAEIQSRGWRAPLYWERRGDSWSQQTLGGPRPVDAAEPVAHLSYYEADAFARWAGTFSHLQGARLPEEAEWERAAAGLPVAGNFAESRRAHPAPAAADPGLLQMFGDVWEWTRSPYTPYPGYAPPAGALGEYNGKFMVNQQVLKGGSCASPASHLRASYRNFFYPAMRWQFSGLRLARDAR